MIRSVPLQFTATCGNIGGSGLVSGSPAGRALAKTSAGDTPKEVGTLICDSHDITSSHPSLVKIQGAFGSDPSSLGQAAGRWPAACRSSLTAEESDAQDITLRIRQPENNHAVANQCQLYQLKTRMFMPLGRNVPKSDLLRPCNLTNL